jgi:DNA mismatch repair ATPase MutS
LLFTDIHALIKEYRSSYGLNSLKVQFSSKRGHYLLMNEEKLAQIPEIFIQINRQARGRLICTTEALLRLNQRFEDSLSEVLLCTNRVVEELLHR